MCEAIAAAAIMTPGTYLRKRREAAGLSIEDVAHMLSPAPHGADRVATELRLIEQDRPTGSPYDLVDELPAIFKFDRPVYDALVVLHADPNGELPVPQICRVCACTWNDACVDPRRGPCCWLEVDLCSHCEDKVPANDPAPEASHAA